MGQNFWKLRNNICPQIECHCDGDAEVYEWKNTKGRNRNVYILRTYRLLQLVDVFRACARENIQDAHWVIGSQLE